VRVEVGRDVAATGGRVARGGPPERRRERLLVPPEETGDAVDDQLRGRAAGEGDDRRAAGHGLGEHHTGYCQVKSGRAMR
jgi:hypothetical protein